MDDAPEGVLFQVLGPFEAVVDGHAVPLGGARPRLVLAALAARANSVVPTDRLIDIVWGEAPPDSALSTLQKYVYRLRSLVGADRLVTRAPGYLLRIGEGESDASRFESLLADASRLGAAGELEEAHSTFDAALALWRGQAWGEFAAFDFARGEVARLDGLRAAAIDDRTEVALAAGRHAEVIGELEAIVAEYPFRERPRGQLMLALYCAGRQADALRAYEAFRRYLGEEVGLEPSAQLVQLADAIVLQKPELDWAPPPRTDAEAGDPISSPRQTRPPPSAITRIVGRAAELDELGAQLREERLVTLTGAGGVGKTRLAIAAADAAGPEFPDGVVWVDLASVSSPADVPQAVADALRVPAQPNVPLVTSVCAAANGRRLLVVLDNCEHVRAAAAGIAGALVTEAEPVTVLATSRELLGVDGEQVLALGPLAADGADAPAVELLRQRIGHPPDRPGEVSALIDIAQRLDGLPLSIELAAARCRSLGTLEVAARLDDAFGLLADRRRPIARHQTLDAALRWSYDLLESAEQTMLCRLGVFAAGFSLEGAEQVAGIDPVAADDLVASLVDKSLLVRGQARFRLLDTTRQFARRNLAETGDEDDARRAYAAYVVDQVRHIHDGLHGPDERVWVDLFDADWPDIRAVIRRGLENGDADTVTELIAHLGVEVLNERPEAFPWAQEAAARWGDRPGPYQAELLGSAAVAAYTLGDPATAVTLGERALAAQPSPGSTIDCIAEVGASGAHAGMGSFERAVEIWHAAVAALMAGDDLWKQAYARTAEGLCLLLAGGRPDLAELTATAVAIASRTGNPSSRVFALGIHAGTLAAIDPAAAAAALAEAESLAAQTRDFAIAFTRGLFASLIAEQSENTLAAQLERIERLVRSGRIYHTWWVLWSTLTPLAALARTEEAALTLGACEASGVAKGAMQTLPAALLELQAGRGPARWQELRAVGATLSPEELLRILSHQQPLPHTPAAAGA